MPCLSILLLKATFEEIFRIVQLLIIPFHPVDHAECIDLPQGHQCEVAVESYEADHEDKHDQLVRYAEPVSKVKVFDKLKHLHADGQANDQLLKGTLEEDDDSSVSAVECKCISGYERSLFRATALTLAFKFFLCRLFTRESSDDEDCDEVQGTNPDENDD